MRRALTLCLLMALPMPAGAADTAPEQIVAGLSQSQVSITTSFNGSEILIYGAVKRSSPVPPGPELQVVITVEGPAAGQIVRRKDRRFGIWLNNAKVTISQAPSFYAVASTAPLTDVLSQTEDLRYRISLPTVIRAVGISAEATQSPAFVEALVRIRKREGRYSLAERAVSLKQDTLFRADIALPANLTEGNYRVRIFLTRGGTVVNTLEGQIDVRKEGLERLVFRMAHDQPLLYGLLSLVLAVVAGWGASAVFRLFRA